MGRVSRLSLLLPLLALGLTAAGAREPITGSGAVPVADLVKQVDIPYQRFTLDNGLKVLVHTDRKAPIVAVSIWYDVGSTREPKGKTGFAHLFEHLMFNGSENVPGDFFAPLEDIGATDYNGTTSYDRTNYFETVPAAALERALFLESDRMGHLLGAVTQQTLTNQIGVVQNEKRQGDTQPYGLVEYTQIAALMPPEHPYGHSVIGSMADLDAASLEDVKNWFRQHYGPNNAVLVLAGDVDVAQAKPLVEKYFGDIARGPEPVVPEISVPTLPAPKTEVIMDRVATTRIYRDWIVPGLNDPDAVPLAVGATVLGGLASSRLDNILVRQEKLAVAVTASLQELAGVSQFEVTVDVKPGADLAQVYQRLDAILGDYIAKGPTAEEVQRVATSAAAGRISGLESVGGFGGKAVALAEGELYSKDPEFYKKQLAAYAAVTPEQVTKAMQKWLTRPVYALYVMPGQRVAYEESSGVPASVTEPETASSGPVAARQAAGANGVDRSKLPDVGTIADLDFPKVERATLSNGVELVYAHRDAVPITQMAFSLDAGNAADPKANLGTQSLLLSLLDEGTTTLDSVQIAERQEILGASISTGASMDRTSVNLFALSANLAPSLDLFADIVKNPAFAPGEVERLRGQQLARIASEMTQPQALALRTLPPLLYGKDHPYGVPFTGTGDPKAVAQVSRDDLVAFHNAWFRPDKAMIFVVSDLPLAKVKSEIEARFGTWAAQGPAGVKDFSPALPPAKNRIVLVDRKDSPQSLILAGEILPVKGTDELVELLSANDVVGGNFLSRINMDLRETKGWSYGVNTLVNRVAEQVPYMVFAPVQADKTGASIEALRQQIGSFLTNKGVTPEELERTRISSIRQLPGSFETAGDVLGAMQRNILYKRSDDYYDGLTTVYRGMTAHALDKAARAAIDPDQFLWVVVGDATTVKPQLEKLGLPIEVVQP
ncbi:M16 family metallopeptidase [Sphingobium boeckii]|uniref:Putative Zn-dependent peptidase n=1 Tax=Sphingobium boeckii TaxID=1082345 RepID=A0A7W9ECV6_9SPHN|nr:pitrilysin family protein [Sphingobium boeckii]MBB5684663.1 putative Zn-dependent peptidase [Sphingobium boeckii]